MSDFLETLQYRVPTEQLFIETIIQCGTNSDKFDFVIHCLSWVKRTCNPKIVEALCNYYFSNPSIFLNIWFKFGRPVENDNIFKKFIELVTKPATRTGTTAADSDLLGQVARLNLPPVSPTVNNTFFDGDRSIPEYGKLEPLRKKWLQYFKKYWKHAASWPVNKDPTVFQTFTEFIRSTLKVPPFSDIENEYIDAYKKIESNLGTLTSIDMNGAGLPPMFLSFGVELTTEESNGNYNYNRITKDAWKSDTTSKINTLRQSIDNLDEMELLDATYEKYFLEDIRRFISIKNEQEKYFDDVRKAVDEASIPDSGFPELNDIAKDYYNKRMSETKYRRAESRIVNAETNLENVVAGSETYIEQWQYMNIPTSDDGIMARWYDWASQFWLKDAYNKWFNKIANISRSEEIQDVFQATQIILIDDSSTGSDKYSKYGLNILSAPQLVYVLTLRNKSPWWRPPSLEESVINTDAAVDIEEIDLETKRIETIHNRLNELKKSIDEGLLLNGSNVVFYTTTASIIGYCLANNIDIIIYNLWLSKSPISIMKLREWVLRHPSLCGQSTRQVSQNTRILTFVALLTISTSSGMPLYVGFGWDNIFSQWMLIVKEFGKLVPADRNKADETCAWLAKEDGDDIIINKRLLLPLFSRILHSKFAGDRKKAPLFSNYQVYKSNYNDLFAEQRIGTGRVEPVPIISSWNPLTEIYYQEKEKTSESVIRSRLKQEEEKRKKIIDEQYNNAMNVWRQGLNKLNDDINKKNKELENKETERLATKSTMITALVESINQTQQQIYDDTEDFKETAKKIVELRKKIPEIDVELKRAQEQIKPLEEQFENTFQSFFGEGASLSNTIRRLNEFIQQKIDEKEKTQLEIYNEDTAQELRKLGLQQRQADLDTQVSSANEFIRSNDGNGQIVRRNNIWEADFDVIRELARWKSRTMFQPTMSEEEYESIKSRPKKTEIISVDQAVEDVGPEDLMPSTTVSSLTKIRKDKDWDNSSPTDINAFLETTKCVEWAYAQRCHFQDNYYAPKDLEKIIITFGIRFKDWTGTKTITINN